MCKLENHHLPPPFLFNFDLIKQPVDFVKQIIYCAFTYTENRDWSNLLVLSG